MKHHGDRCFFCGIEFGTCGPGSAKTVDHLIPRSSGGTHESANLVHACYLCNHKKANKTAEEFESSEWLQTKRVEVMCREIRISYRYTHTDIKFSKPGWHCNTCQKSGSHDESPCLTPCEPK